MKNISCLIIDDEPRALALLEDYVQRTPFLELKGKYSSAIEAMSFFQLGQKIDVVFLDIEMPELTGMDLAKILPDETRVIFSTAFDQYAIEGYKVSALDYLLKPFDYVEFLHAAIKAKDWVGSFKKITQPDNGQYIFIKSEYRQIKILLTDILYIEGLKDYAKIFLASGPKPIVTLMSLKKLEDELSPFNFMRIHRSFIVSLDKIEILERNQVIFPDQRITVARQYKEAFDQFVKGRILS
jgi:DNA-binding LytR/AlgR family response regulator